MACQVPIKVPRAWANSMTQYVHKYYPEITCETVSTTARGWKVLQKDPKHKKKPKVAFYDFIDFSDKKGFWIAKKDS